MPARMVYAPKAYVYTKDQAGVTHNFTDYVVSGSVQRNINQVSTAQVTLRNPLKIFTTPSVGVAFHPMDPITIYLERLPGYPVRVFTGYLDTTPYYQLYPKTVTLQASCTLKKLLYSFFDPSLPYVIAFFEKYGWINTGQGSIISTSAFNSTTQGASQADINAGKQPFSNTLLDGSIGKLLWAILYDIGEWNDSNIYIESLPTGPNGIAARMSKLMSSLQGAESIASADFTLFLNNVIGSSSQGSGGGAGAVGGGKVTSTLLNANQRSFASAFSLTSGLDPNVVAAWVLSEEPASSATAPNGANNWLNVGSTNSGFLGGTDPHWTDPTRAGQFSAQWMEGIATPQGYATSSPGIQAIGKTAGKSPQAQIAAIQQSGWATSGYPLLPSVYQSILNSPGVSKPSLSNYLTQSGSTAPTQGKGRGNPSVVTQSPSTPGNTTNLSVSSQGGASGVALAALNRQQTQSCFHYQEIRPIQYEILAAKTVHIDCSGFAIACYKNAGWGDPSHNNYNGQGYTGDMISHAKRLSKGATDAQPGDLLFFGSSESATTHVNVYVGNGQAISMGREGDPSIGPAEQMGPSGFLGYYRPDTAGVGISSSASAANSVSSTSTAEAFVAELQFPSIEDQITAIALGAEHKGLMHDQSLMPFVQQVAQASMRSFMSLPNGDFYAFYPDYFGEMGHHKPYWYIRDIEILDGGISLTDDALSTHVFAVGDNTWPINNELLNMLFSAGTINIFNAFVTKGIVDTSGVPKKDGLAPGIMTSDEAVKFIQRYGALPLVQNYPMVRSPIFEMLLAYQQFMLSWSNQFKSPFTFTFMPELFPGGKVGFPDHGIQMFVNSVTHSWNYEEGGFTTQAELIAPSLLEGFTTRDFPDLPPYMVQAIIEPIRQAASTTTSSPNVGGGNSSTTAPAGTWWRQQQQALETQQTTTPTTNPSQNIANHMGHI